MSGERGDVDTSLVTDWKGRLPGICEGFAPKDIFNMDETGLVFKDTTRSTFHVKGEDCAGGKRSKERITVALCASMTGEKLTPLVIGKSRKPRSFSNIKPERLPVVYRNNTKAWMTSNIFEEWLRTLDRMMRKARRHILLFLDNAPSHPHLVLQNITLKFFPPNTTSLLQPMDQGIIQTLKLKYRKRQLRHVVASMEKHPEMTGTDFLKQVTVLHVIYWISSSWKEVEASTVSKCFAHCGFVFEGEGSASAAPGNESVDDLDDVPLAVLKMSKDLFGCEFKDLVDIDRAIATKDNDMTDWTQPASELLKATTEGSKGEEESDDVPVPEAPVIPS